MLQLIIGIYRHPMFWWVIVPLIFTTVLVVFMLWEGTFGKNFSLKDRWLHKKSSVPPLGNSK